MVASIPWRWLTVTGLSQEAAQLMAYFFTPIGALVAVVLLQNTFTESHCIFQGLLKIPCPGCGITHSINCILVGEFDQAWEFNPAGFVVFAALIGQSLITAAEATKIVRSGARLYFASYCGVVVSISLVLVWVVHLIKI